mgnify:CR=1 FL=1
MFEGKNISIFIQDRCMIKNLNFTLNKGDKLAIIGEEGNGKSTLLMALLGICPYAKMTGTIQTKGNRIGYLKQTIEEEILEKTGYEYVFEDDFYRGNAFYKKMDLLKFKEDRLTEKIKNLSGGEKVKIRLLKLLLEENDLLFLDEPTDDLDIETLEWLETFIQNTNIPILYVSHDETLLSRTANKILHLEQRKKKTESHYTLLKIDYDTYVNQRQRALEKQTQVAKFEKREFQKKQEKLNQVMQKVEYQQNTISRKDPHGARLLKKKMHALKSQEKKLENFDGTKVPDVEEGISFAFETVEIPKNKKILDLKIPELKAQDNVLATNIELEVFGNVHLCIIGPNGIGKTTLMKEIREALKERKDLHVGYMPQNYEDLFNEEEPVLHFLVPNSIKEDLTKARAYLGNMKFTRDEMNGKIKDLSNGSKAKLILTKFVLERCDVLLLDEPTRNVSPLSNPVIRQALKEFNGTILSISHDRKYIDEVIDCLYLLTEEGLVKKNIVKN